MINCAVPSTEFLDRRFDVFVVTDLDALVEISVFKKTLYFKQIWSLTPALIRVILDNKEITAFVFMS